MNPAIAALLGAVCTGAVTLLVAIISIVVGRGGRRADIADKVSETWERTSARLDHDIAVIEEKCDKCQKELETATTRAAAAERRADEAERRADAAERRADRNDRTNSALIDAWTDALPLLAADEEATKFLRATIRLARQSRYKED